MDYFAQPVIAALRADPVARDDADGGDCFAEPVIGRAFARPIGSQCTSYLFTSGQRDDSKDWNASLAGTVPSSL